MWFSNRDSVQPLSNKRQHSPQAVVKRSKGVVMVVSACERVLVANDADDAGGVVHHGLQGKVGAGQRVHHQLNGSREAAFDTDLRLDGEVTLGFPH